MVIHLIRKLLPSPFARLSATVLLGLVIGAAAQTPVPFLSQPLVPSSAAPGANGFTLTVDGAQFVPGATIYWNGQALGTRFVSTDRLTATVPASDVASAGTAFITVKNPGTPVASNGIHFPVGPPLKHLEFVTGPGTPQAAPYQPGPCPNGQGTCFSVPQAAVEGQFSPSAFPQIAVTMAGPQSTPKDIILFQGDGKGGLAPSSEPTSPTDQAAQALASGDFTGSGTQDLVAVYPGNSLMGTPGDAISVFLGRGDGTFAEAPGSPITVGVAPIAVAVGDFLRHGKLDLAVLLEDNKQPSNVSIVILPGNGDGTFGTPMPPVPAGVTGAISMAVGDFNGDGKLDIAVGDWIRQANILLGNGDGTFRQAPGSPMMFTNPYANAVSVTLAGDYNGDGVTDLALGSFANNMVTVLLGKGDGTFTQVPNCCGTEWNNVRITSMTEGDFEHDGRLDLAFSALNPADIVSFLHGNGDGTFTPAMTSVVVPNNPVGLIPADYNQSGELGLGFAATPESYLGVLLPQNWTAPPGLSISPVGSSTATIKAGSSATFTVHVASENGFIGPVHPACSITAPETSCTVSPTANLLTASGYTTYMVSVSTTAKKTASSAVATAPPAPDPALPSSFGIGMVVLALAMIARVWRRNGALTAASLPLGMLILLSLTALSCGGRTAPAAPAVIDPGTPAGTYTVTLTASDSTGTVTVSTPLTLTVQSAAN